MDLFAQLDGSFLGLVYSICNSNFGNILAVASGKIDPETIHPKQQPDGVIDSLRFLAGRTDSLARQLFRLIVLLILSLHVMLNKRDDDDDKEQGDYIIASFKPGK